VSIGPGPAGTPARLPWQARLPFFYGWIIVGLGFFTAFFGIGLTWAASIFAVPMQDDLGWSRSMIFLAVSLRGWMGIVVSPVVGRYLDRRNGARVLAVIGGALNTVSLIAISQVSEPWQFILLFGVLGGIAQSTTGGISIAIVPKWFIANRGSAVSISTLGGGLAAFTMPLLLAPMNDELGWRTSWAVVGVLAFVFSGLPAIFLRRQPEDVGLLPDGEKVARGSLAARGPRPAEERSYTLKEALGTSTFWFLMIGVSVGSLACNGVPANVTNMFVDRGFALETASSALVAYGIASILAKVAWGWIANRFHLRTVMMVLAAYGAIAISSFVFMPESLGELALGYGFLVGFFVGAYVPLHGLVWAVYFGRGNVGAISGNARPLGIIMISSGPLFLAGTQDLFGSYTPGLLITSAALLVCVWCMYMARPLPREVVRETDQPGQSVSVSP
jgi:sugar phosphate permease